MNSRKKRFWQVWEKRNSELADVNVKEANRIREDKFIHHLGGLIQ